MSCSQKQNLGHFISNIIPIDRVWVFDTEFPEEALLAEN